MIFRDERKATKYVVRHPGRWVEIPRLKTYRNADSDHDGAAVWTDGTYERGEYETVTRRRDAPEEATICFEHEFPNICDLEWRISHRKTEDRTALQCISYCLTRHITPRRYYELLTITPYQRGSDNVEGVPRVVHEAWSQLPDGVRAFADRPERI
jgi:hypothetical protein